MIHVLIKSKIEMISVKMYAEYKTVGIQRKSLKIVFVITSSMYWELKIS